MGIIARIEARSNAEPNETTGLPPAALFMREKEYLRPVGNVALLERMVGDVKTQVVPPTMLVRAAGREWSVPRRCIGRKAKVTTMPAGRSGSPWPASSLPSTTRRGARASSIIQRATTRRPWKEKPLRGFGHQGGGQGEPEAPRRMGGIDG